MPKNLFPQSLFNQSLLKKHAPALTPSEKALIKGAAV